MRYRYYCKGCEKYYDDLTGTVFEGHHQALKVWILCLYLIGLNLSNRQIAKELNLAESQVYQMATHLREGVVKKKAGN
jgi:transposase-like protein